MQDRITGERPSHRLARAADGVYHTGSPATNARLRVLLWYWGRRGGGAQFTLALASALSRHTSVDLALSTSEHCDLAPEFRSLGLPMLEVPTYSSAAGFAAATARVPLLAARLIRCAREHRADVVLSAMTHLWTPLVAPALRRAGLNYVPVVHDATAHPGDFSLLWNWRLQRELNASAAVVTLSRSVAKGLPQLRRGTEIIQMPLGAMFGASPSQAGVPPDAPFLFFGRLRDYKGLDLLRDAFAILHRAHPEARLKIAGDGDLDALAPGLASMPGVAAEVKWVGDRDIPALLRSARAVVLPYREASQSGVIPIALGAGVPVVATPVGGLMEQVRDGVDGIIAREVSASALASAMARLIDEGTRSRLAEGASASGRELADWDSISDRLVAALRPFHRAGVPVEA